MADYVVVELFRGCRFYRFSPIIVLAHDDFDELQIPSERRLLKMTTHDRPKRQRKSVLFWSMMGLATGVLTVGVLWMTGQASVRTEVPSGRSYAQGPNESVRTVTAGDPRLEAVDVE